MFIDRLIISRGRSLHIFDGLTDFQNDILYLDILDEISYLLLDDKDVLVWIFLVA